MLELAQQVAWAAQVAASDSSNDGINGIAYLFLLSGVGFYALMFLKYRNVNKRHHHETETKAGIADVRAMDALHQSLTGLKNSRMRDANNDSVRGSLNRYF